MRTIYFDVLIAVYILLSIVCIAVNKKRKNRQIWKLLYFSSLGILFIMIVSIWSTTPRALDQKDLLLKVGMEI